MLAKDYWQPKTFCWVFHTHICRAHQAPRAVPWLYYAHGSQSWPALAHLMYTIFLPVPNPAPQQWDLQYCVCISLPVNHAGTEDTCIDSRISTLLYSRCCCCFCMSTALPISQHPIFLTSHCYAALSTQRTGSFSVTKIVTFPLSMPIT